MHISSAETQLIARLARLNLGDGEVARIAAELGSILEHMEELAKLDLTEVVPMSGATDRTAPFREDAPGADPLGLPLAELAPSFTQGFFLVPRLAALDADANGPEGSH